MKVMFGGNESISVAGPNKKRCGASKLRPTFWSYTRKHRHIEAPVQTHRLEVHSSTVIQTSAQRSAAEWLSRGRA